MNENDFLSEEIFKRYGTVQRARGCFLYTKKGVRLTDMYQEGGKAILGWGSSSASTIFKNTLNRGINGSFITEYEKRTEKAVSELLFSRRNVYFFFSKQDALKSSISVFPNGTNFYRPWSAQNVLWNEIPSVILEPPFPWIHDIFILALSSDSLDADKETRDFVDSKNFNKGIKINAPLQAAIARSFYDLIKAFQERKESDWFVYDTILKNYFERKGPYLYPKVPEENYKEMILHFLDCGIVINPFFNQMSIVPFGADKGVFTKLKNNPFEF